MQNYSFLILQERGHQNTVQKSMVHQSIYESCRNIGRTAPDKDEVGFSGERLCVYRSGGNIGGCYRSTDHSVDHLFEE